MSSTNQPPGGPGAGRPPVNGAGRPPQRGVPPQAPRTPTPPGQNPGALKPAAQRLPQAPKVPAAPQPAARNAAAQRPVPPPVAPQQRPPQQPTNGATARLARPAAQPQANARAVPGAGEPYPPLQVTPLDGTQVVDPRPISARSPRAAVQPDNVPAAPRPKRRAKRARNPIVIVGNALLTVIFLLTLVGGIAFVIGKQRFDAPGPLAADKVVDIPRGGIRDTADLLMREGVIDQPYVFIAGALVLKAQNDLKYGEYRFTRNASLRDVIETIIEGKVVQHALTLAEGLTSDQIVQRLMDNQVLSGNIKDVPREGTLLPETYRFTHGITREQMIRRMQEAQRRAVQEIWERRSPDLPIRTPEQLVTLASIVEKETGKPEERTRVAAVFVNRLRNKMKLQSDPTIIYGLVGGKGSLGRPIQRNEIEQPTPYNTYVIDGLPPGPIANPGRASLEAAANPARTKELYFVADGTGGHAFADTYEQHQRNVARLRSLEQQTAEPRATQPAASAKPVRNGRAR